MWASEIKGLLASGVIDADPDVRGIDYFFNYFCMPTERTCFETIRMLRRGICARSRMARFRVISIGISIFPTKEREAVV